MSEAIATLSRDVADGITRDGRVGQVLDLYSFCSSCLEAEELTAKLHAEYQPATEDLEHDTHVFQTPASKEDNR